MNITEQVEQVLLDNNLSLKAKGVMCIMLSMKDDWEFSIEHLVALSHDGTKAVQGAINELRDAGYLKRTPERKNGKILRWVMEIYNKPKRTAK